jgi:hypothetical protein
VPEDAPERIKVFWFFFSKKNAFLASLIQPRLSRVHGPAFLLIFAKRQGRFFGWFGALTLHIVVARRVVNHIWWEDAGAQARFAQR